MNYAIEELIRPKNRALTFLINSTAVSVCIAGILAMLYFGFDMFVEQSSNFNPEDFEAVFAKAVFIVLAAFGLAKLTWLVTGQKGGRS